jgi:hypothetical protein
MQVHHLLIYFLLQNNVNWYCTVKMTGLADKPEAQFLGVKVLNCTIFKTFLEAIMCDFLQKQFFKSSDPFSCLRLYSLYAFADLFTL